MGAFDDLIPSSKGSGTFDDLVPGGKPGSSEGFLQRAMGIGKRAVQSAITPQPSQFDPQHPFLSAIGATTGFENAPGLGALQSGERARGSIIEDAVGPGLGSTVVNIATDPLTWAGGGLAGKGTIRAIGKTNTGKAIGNVITKQGRLQYFDKVEKAVYSARGKASDRFITDLEKIASSNPGKSVDVSNFSNKAIELSNSDPMVKSIIDESPEVMDILTNPTGKISLIQAQKALNSMRSKISKGVLGGSGKRSSHVPVMDLIDDLSLSMSEGFPEIARPRKEYGDVVNSFRTIRSKVKGDAASKNLFADYNPINPRGKEFMGGERSEEAFKTLLKEDPRLFKEAKLTRKVKVGKDVIVGGGLLGALEAARRKFFG